MGSYTLTGYIIFVLHISLSVKVQGEVRLQGGSNIFEGIVEVNDNNNWVRVCLEDFDLIDAEVVCQQIFQQSAISVVDGSQFGPVASGNQLSGVACTEADTTLQNCPNNGYSNVCTASAGVTCKLYGYYGCYTNAIVTALKGALYAGRADLTIQDCIERCRNADYTFSGTINGQQCSCGNTIEKSPGDDSVVAESLCNVPCSGDSSEICGGDGYTSIYISSIGQQGGTYTSTEGYIYSPNFPGAYMGETVSWTVTFENPTFTTVTIKMFDVSANDQLVLTSSTGGSMETHLGSSGISLPYVWNTDLTSSFQIQLMSSTTESNNGLVITYKAISGTCGGSFSGTSGYIASPEFPNDAPPSSSCTYTIAAPDNYIIELDLQQRLLPSGSFISLVDNGVISSISSIGKHGPSTGNVLIVSFISGTTSSPSTFIIKYTASQRPCDALPTISSGTLDQVVTGTVYPPLTVSFTCDQGYSSPVNSITCMDDGSWTSAECTAMSTAMATTTHAATTGAATTHVVTTDAVTTKAAATTADTTQPEQNPTTATASEAPPITTPAPGSMTTKSTTAMPNQPTQAVVTTMETMQTQPITSVSEQPTSDLCRVSRDPIMESLDMTEPENMLALNVGNPLDCDGYLTGIEIFSSDMSTVTISVLRFLEPDMYQLIGRFDVVGQTSTVVQRSLDQGDWIKFESGDMIGTSSASSSPLTFSDNQADSVDYMIWDLSADADFHTSDVGDVISLTNTNNRPRRTYSWAVFITENITCAKPDIQNAKITDSPSDNSIIVECHDGYSPEKAKTLKCRADGTFESFTCTEKDRKTFVIIIAVVCVAVIGILMMIVIVMMSCVEEEEPIKQKPKIRSTFTSTGSSRSDNSQRFLIIEDDGGRDLGISNPIPVVAKPPSHLPDHQYPPVDYPLDDERAAIQAIDEAVLGFEVDSLSFESGPIDTRSGGDSARHHVTFSDRR